MGKGASVRLPALAPGRAPVQPRGIPLIDAAVVDPDCRLEGPGTYVAAVPGPDGRLYLMRPLIVNDRPCWMDQETLLADPHVCESCGRMRCPHSIVARHLAEAQPALPDIVWETESVAGLQSWFGRETDGPARVIVNAVSYGEGRGAVSASVGGLEDRHSSVIRVDGQVVHSRCVQFTHRHCLTNAAFETVNGGPSIFYSGLVDMIEQQRVTVAHHGQGKVTIEHPVAPAVQFVVSPLTPGALLCTVRIRVPERVRAADVAGASGLLTEEFALVSVTSAIGSPTGTTLERFLDAIGRRLLQRY